VLGLQGQSFYGPINDDPETGRDDNPQGQKAKGEQK
jgi:hypothetical protein